MKKIFTIILASVLMILNMIDNLFSEETGAEAIRATLPKFYGTVNQGTEFWLTIPPCLESGYNDYIRIFVTSDYHTPVTLEIPSIGYSKTQTINPYNIVDFELSPSIAQPFDAKTGVVEKVYKDNGIHITSDYPVIVYVLVNFNRSSDGYLALPVSGLGKDYVAASYGDLGQGQDSRFPSEVCIVAAFDRTSIAFTLGGNSVTETPGGLQPGQTATQIIDKGDVWVFNSDGNEADLTGSKISATKPVAVFSGNVCANVPTTVGNCDYIVEMDLPSFAWGKTYFVPKVPDRSRPSIVRIFAKEPGTTIYRDGQNIGTIASFGGVISKGYLEMRMVPYADIPQSAAFHSDKPIAITFYNTGATEDGFPRPLGDPYMTAQTPLEQYTDEITFFTPGVIGKSFSENYLNLIYETNQDGFMSDDYELGSYQTGDFNWKQLKYLYPGADEVFKYEEDGKFAVKDILISNAGLYKIRSNHRMAGYLFGLNFSEGYGYPASIRISDLSKDDSLPPVPVWTEKPDGNIDIATVTDMPNNDHCCNLSTVFYYGDESYNYKFEHDEIIPGESKQIRWKLKIIDPNKDARAVISFFDRRGNDTTIIIEHFSGNIAVEPSVYDFGGFKPGETKTIKFKALNHSEMNARTVTQLQLLYGDRGFDISGVDLPVKIEPMDSAIFNVTFTAPAKSGEYIDSVGIGDASSFSYQAVLRASVGEPVIQASDIDFGDLTIGKILEKDFSISNDGNVDLKITGMSNFSDDNSSIFSTNLPEISIEVPLIIPAGGSLTFKAIFSPGSRAQFSDSLVFTSDAGTNSDPVVILKGVGIRPEISIPDIDFGNVEMGVISRKDTKIENKGEDDLQVIGCQGANNPGFKLLIAPEPSAELPIIIKPGESHDVSVEFEPSEVAQEAFDDEITIVSNSVEPADNIITLSVQSVQPSSVSEELKKSGIEIYPIPVKDIFHIKISNAYINRISVNIYDAGGRLVSAPAVNRETGNSSLIEADLSGLPGGVYYLKIITNIKTFNTAINVVK